MNQFIKKLVSGLSTVAIIAGSVLYVNGMQSQNAVVNEEEITYVFNNDGTGRLTYIDEYYDTPDVYRYDFTYEMTNSTHGSLVYDGYYGMESHLFEIEEDRMYVFQEADNQVIDMVYKQ